MLSLWQHLETPLWKAGYFRGEKEDPETGCLRDGPVVPWYPKQALQLMVHQTFSAT